MTALDAAEAAATAAKAAYRTNPTEAARAAYKDTAAEVRYQRWAFRGGPDLEPTKATAAFHARRRTENPKG